MSAWTTDTATAEWTVNKYGNRHGRGATLLFDGKPVELPAWVEVSVDGGNVKTDEYDHVIGHATLMGEAPNGWGIDARMGYGGDPTALVLAGCNWRGMAAREAAEQEDSTLAKVGDGWDFSYLKTGYDNPRAYIQWSEVGEDDDFEGELWLDVPDPTTLHRRLAMVEAQNPLTRAEIYGRKRVAIRVP